MGFFARLPITVVIFTGSCSIKGGGFSCAPRIRISSQFGMAIFVPMASIIVFPLTAISWISFI